MQDQLDTGTPIPPNWYSDPTGRAVQRYWNGQAWTAYVVDGQGVQRIDDPVASGPSPDQPMNGSAAAHGIVIQNVIHQQVAPQVPLFAPGSLGFVGQKSPGVSLLLTFFFGPLGLLYTSVSEAVVLCLISLVALPLTLGLAVFVIWPIAMVKGVNGVHAYNRALAGPSGLADLSV